ncbi:MAG: 30S ribosomal protein S20, partial [Gammaproteobacteria bacterium]
MANSPQAKKRARQSEQRRQNNASRRSLLRTRIKQVIKAIETGDKAAAQAAYGSAVPVIDRMAGASIIH